MPATVPLAWLLAGCQRSVEAPAPEIRPVRAITIDKRAAGGTVALTGTVQAQTEINQSFRIDGRLIERTVDVGDNVKPGQLIARLDPQNEESGAAVGARPAGRPPTRSWSRRAAISTRMRDLWSRTPSRARSSSRPRRCCRPPRRRCKSAQAQLNLAQNRLSYTRLFSDVAGVVTARGPQPGEVVSAGRMIIQVAREGARDAVFDVPAQIKDSAPEGHVRGKAGSRGGARDSRDPHKVTAAGRVREVSPRADPVTGTFAVRVRLIDPPRDDAPGQHRHRPHAARCRSRHRAFPPRRWCAPTARRRCGSSMPRQDRVAAQHRGAHSDAARGAGGFGPEPR